MDETTRILIVDDDPNLLRSHSRLLRKTGYEVIEATTGEDGLRLAQEHKPDLILLDAALPDVSGVEVCRRVKADPELAGSFVVLLSGVETTSDERAEGLEAGADGYIAQSVSNRELLARTEALLRIKRTEPHRNAAPETLRDSRERLLKAQRVARMGFLDWDLKTDEIKLSEEIVRLYGLDPDEKWTTPELMARVVHADDLEFVQENLDLAISGEKDYDIDHRVVRPDGKILWVHAQAELTRDPDGNPETLLGAVVDITKRKQAEEALQESERRYRQLFDLAQEGVWVIDANSITTMVNPSMAEMLGYAVEEMVGQHLFSFMDERDVEIAKRNLERRRRGISEQHDFGFLHKDGTRIHTTLETTPILDSEGNYVGAIAGVIDISERVQAEQRFRLTAEAGSDLIYEWDVETDALEWFGSFDEALGYQPGEIPRAIEGWIELIHPDDLEQLDDSVERHRTSTEPIYEEYKIRHKDGRWRHWVDRGMPVLDEEGKPCKWIGACIDVTERVHAEERSRLLSSSVEQSTEGIAVSDLEGNLLFVNNAFAAMHGYTPEELVGRHLSIFHTKEQIPPVEAANRQIRETGEFSDDIWHVRRDGTVFPTLMHNSLLRDETGDPIGMIGTLRDITERVRTEQALRDSESKFRSIFDLSPQAITLTDLDTGSFIDVNAKLCELSKYTREELLGRTTTELGFYTRDDREKVIKELKASGEIHGLEMDFKVKEDSIVNTLMFSRLLQLENEPYMLSMFLDITERKRSEAERERLLAQQIAINQLALALGESRDIEEIYHIIYEHVQMLMDADAFVISSYDGETQLIHAGYVVVEGEVLEATALPPIPLEEEDKGTQSRVIHTGEPFYNPDYRETEKDTQTQYTIQKNGTVIEGSPPPEEGEKSSNSVLYAPMKIEGESIGVMQVQSYRLDAYSQEDIDLLSALANVAAVAIQNARLLERTRQQARRIQQTIDTVPEGVLLLDAEHKVVLANPVAERDMAVLADAQVGDTVTRLGDRQLEELLTSPPTKGLWHEVKRKGRTFEVIARPMENGPEPEDWVLVINDVTQERETREQLQRQEQLAAVGQLAAGIAHDFNNIMAIIVLYAQMMSRAETLSEQGQKRLATINQQARHATNLIQQILDFSRRSVLERQPLDLLLLLKEEVKLLERTLPEHIEIGLDYGHDEYTINADPTRMQQMITNLAINARDAMPEGGSLRVKLERIEIKPGKSPLLPEIEVAGAATSEWVKVAVSDTGTGIPQDALSHIFEPFFTTKEPGAGIGLGLAQVHGIVGQHGGRISVETQVRVGREQPGWTTFTIYLPALPVQPAEPLVLEEQGLIEGQGETVLVVEDEAAVRNAIVESLKQLSYRVLEAANGEEALEVLEHHGGEIALVLSDVVMPEMGGIALFHALKQEGLAAPVVLMTGHPMEDELEELRTEGLSDYLLKPLKVEDLAQALARALNDENDEAVI